MNYRIAGPLAVSICTVLLVGCSGKESRIQAHLAKGEAFLAQSENEKAMVEIHNVLQMDPKRPEAYYLGGEIEESRSELRNSYANFSKAVEEKPDYYDAQAGLARLNLTVGNDAEAQKQVDSILSKDPKNVQATAVAAALQARKGNVDAAIKMVNDNAAGGTLPPSTATVLAALYASKGEFSRGETVIANSLAANKKDVSLLMIDAELNRRQNKPEQVLADYQRATDAAPKNFKVWQSWSEFEERAGHIPEAEQVLQNSIKAVPDDSTRRVALVNLITRHEGEAAGLKTLQAISEDRPHDYLIGFALSDYYTSKGEIGSARDVLTKIEHSDGKGISGMRARDELATFDLATGDVAKARSATEDILKIDPRDSSALMLRGRIELSDNQIDAAIADFRGAARDKPDSVQVLALLAKAYDIKKQPDLARDTLADAAKLYPNHPEIALLQIQYLESGDHLADAALAADDAMRRNPNNFDLVKAKIALQEKQKDLAAAEQTLIAWQSTHPNDANATMRLGQLYALDKKPDNALAQYDRAATLEPGSFDPSAAALQLLISQKKYPEAQRRVDSDIAKAPNLAVNYQLRGDVLSAAGDNAGAETAYRHAIEVQPTAVTAYLNLANFQAAQHHLDDARATFDAAMKSVPKNSLLETAYADFLTKSQQYDAAIALLEQMLAELPSNATAANNLAFILTQFKGDPKSLERAAALTKGFEYSTNPSFLDTVAWTDYKMGKYDEAVAVYQRAALMVPNSAALQMRYGMALYKSGATAAAQDHLRLAAKSGGKLPDDAQQMLAKG